MKFLRLALLALPFLMINAFAVNEYKAPTDDINTNTGTFPVDDVELKDAQEEQLKMQKEEVDPEKDSFGQDKFNENVDPDKLDSTKDTY